MGLIDNIRNLFSKPKKPKQGFFLAQVNEYENKCKLADNIVKNINSIKEINKFDSSIWNLSKLNSFDFKQMSLQDLQKLDSILSERLEELNKFQNTNIKNSFEESKWTEEKSQNMSEYDSDGSQRDR